MRKNQILGTAVLGAPAQPITRHNRESSTSASNTKMSSTASRNPKLGSAAMKSGSSRLTVNSHVVVALYEGRGQARGIVGIAAMDINKPTLVLCEISDTQTYTNTLTKVNILRPVEVLIPSFVECTTPSRIFTMLKDQFPNLTVSSVSRSAFSSNRGLSYLKSLRTTDCLFDTVNVEDKLYALASACALIEYIQKEHHITYPTRSIKIEYQEPEGNFQQDQPKQDPIPAPVMQRPREGVIMNPKKKSKRKSRSSKDIKNKLPFEHYKQPAKTRTKRVSSPLFKHEKKTAKKQLTVPEPYVRPRRAKTAKTPCYLEEASNTESLAKSTITSRQEMNLPDTTKSRISWPRIPVGQDPWVTISMLSPRKSADYIKPVVSGKRLMKRPIPDRDESIFSVDSEKQFVKHLASKGVTSTPLSSNTNTDKKRKMLPVFPGTVKKLLESSDDSLSNDVLDIHCRSRVGVACPKKPTKTDLISGRKSNVKQGRSNKNKQIVVDEIQLSAGCSQSVTTKSQTVLRPPKLIFKHEDKSTILSADNNEETKNKPAPSTLNEQEQNRKRKPKQQSKRNPKVAGKPTRLANMMPVGDKFSEDLASNEMETQVMAPRRSKRLKAQKILKQ